MRARVVVFDVGGVMVRISRTWQEALSQAGIPVGELPDIPAHLDSPSAFGEVEQGLIEPEPYLASLGKYLGVTRDEALRAHHAILRESYAGTEDMVREVHASGYESGILSNTNALHWPRLTDPAHFPAIAACKLKLASFEVKVRKPDPEIFRAYMRRFDLLGHEVIFFEDNPANVDAARSLGWRAHLVDYSQETVPQMRHILAQESDPIAIA